MNDCDCSTDLSDMECSPSLFDEKIVKGRKEYKCCECSDVILKGDKHERVKGLWDGDFNTYRTCLFCLKIRKFFCSRGWVYGMLVEDIKEILGFDYRESRDHPCFEKFLDE